MREHIHAPAHDEFMIQPAWNEPSRDAAGKAPRLSLRAYARKMKQDDTAELERQAFNPSPN